MTLLPREHGAYGQIILPLATALIAGGLTRPAVLLAAAVVMGFLAHEPLLVLLGGRGTRVRREQRVPAAVWLAATGIMAIAAALMAVPSLVDGTRWSLLVPIVPAGVLAAMTTAGREKSLVGELAVAFAFSGASFPVALATGMPERSAAAIAVVFAAIFVSATLGVRGVILTVRGGGNPGAARATRIATLCVALGFGSGIVAAANRGLVTDAATIAAAPGLLAGLWLAAFPPSPTKLRTVGWTLVATSTAAAILLVVGR